MKNRIHIDPNIHFGKPCIAGTRIPVTDVLDLVNHGLSFSEIVKDYFPDVKEEDLHACIQYAIDIVNAEDIKIAIKA